MERKKGEQYSKEFRQQAVERMNACENIARLSRELGVARHLLYHWRDRLEQTHPSLWGGWHHQGKIGEGRKATCGSLHQEFS